MFRFDQQNSDRVFLQVPVDEQDCIIKAASSVAYPILRSVLTENKFCFQSNTRYISLDPPNNDGDFCVLGNSVS